MFSYKIEKFCATSNICIHMIRHLKIETITEKSYFRTFSQSIHAFIDGTKP